MIILTQSNLVRETAAWNISYLFDAGNCANGSVALGFTSPATLLVASRIEVLSKDPLSYFCAMEDYEIVATKKSTLRRCAGGCPSAFKPSYCSKDCQRAVRFLSRTPSDAIQLSYRIGNITNRPANQSWDIFIAFVFLAFSFVYT